jgi:hypothetical protein
VIDGSVSRAVARAIDPAEAGLLHHHGPEVIPVVELIVGGALPLAAAVWLGRVRSASERLAGGRIRSGVTAPPLVTATARRSTEVSSAGHDIEVPPPPRL